MSQTRHDPPTALLEMFERREGDVRPALPMPPAIRRRVRVRRGAIAGAAVAAFALAVAIAVGTLPLLKHSQPATPQPLVPSLAPTASGQTEIYRWRVLAGQGEGGRVETELQTSSLAGGPWATVAERSFDPTATAFTATYLAGGQYLDRPSTTVVWGFVPPGTDRVVFEPGEGCEPITIDAADAVAPPGETIRLWATDLRCSGPGTIVAQASDGTAIATTGYTQPIPADVWSLTTSRHGGIGWVLRRILDPPTGIGIGDAGNPNDIGSPIRGDQLSDDRSDRLVHDAAGMTTERSSSGSRFARSTTWSSCCPMAGRSKRPSRSCPGTPSTSSGRTCPGQPPTSSSRTTRRAG